MPHEDDAGSCYEGTSPEDAGKEPHEDDEGEAQPKRHKGKEPHEDDAEPVEGQGKEKNSEQAR
eukprot:5052060-Heterocapsa_arctica.AAC.1